MKKKSFAKIILLLTISSALILQSCGRKGDLYLPNGEQQQEDSDNIDK